MDWVAGPGDNNDKVILSLWLILFWRLYAGFYYLACYSSYICHKLGSGVLTSGIIFSSLSRKFVYCVNFELKNDFFLCHTVIRDRSHRSRLKKNKRQNLFSSAGEKVWHWQSCILSLLPFQNVSLPLYNWHLVSPSIQNSHNLHYRESDFCTINPSYKSAQKSIRYFQS